MIGFTSHLLIFGRKLSGGGGGGGVGGRNVCSNAVGTVRMGGCAFSTKKIYIFAGGYLFRTLET